MRKKVVIVGAGVGGLASAIRLTVSGFEVEIFENSAFAGGKIAEFRKNGYRFDTGASVITLPGLVQELFVMAGEDPEQYILFHKLEISCKYFYNDGTIIDAFTDTNKFIQEIKEKTNAEPYHLQSFLKESSELFDLTAKPFLFSPFQKLSTLLSQDGRKLIRNLNKLDIFRSLHHSNRKTLSDPKLIQLFDRYATYNGSNPFQAPATLKTVAHLEHNTGLYLPEKGMYELIRSLVKLTEKLNIKINYNTTVDEIVVKNKMVKGIRCGEKYTEAVIVISNADIYLTYKKLLKNINLPATLRYQALSSSAILFYWGIKTKIPKFDIHNVLFSGDYREEFRHIFKYGTIYNDPTIYIYISSKLNPADAPDNRENWLVMINTPNNTGQDWNALRDTTRKSVIRKINKILDMDIEKYIETEDYEDPVRIEHFTDSYRGALYGPSSNKKLSAFYRHANFSRKIKGLYFASGSVHPGGGIPICFASAQIVSNLIIEDYCN